MTFKIPKSKYGDGFTGKVDLDVTLNGVDFTSFEDGFLYYGQPTVTGTYPKFGPLGGLDPLVISADLLNDECPSFNGTCKIGSYVGVLTIVDP